MIEKDIQIRNIMGLHARPAACLVRLASKFPCNIELIKDHMNVDGKSILGVMSLAAEKGSVITIRATGDKEHEAVNQLIGLLNKVFDEEESQNG